MKKLCGKNGHDILKGTQNALGNLSAERERLLTKLKQYVIWFGKYTLPIDGTDLDDHNLRQKMSLINRKIKRVTSFEFDIHQLNGIYYFKL